MPLTPFHWSALVFGLAFFGWFYIPALAVSSVVMDVEPFYFLFISPNLDGSLHGFFHTMVGASLLAALVAFVLIKFRKPIDKTAALAKIGQEKLSNRQIYFSSFAAAYSHILLDSFMHKDVKLFWPLSNSNLLLEFLSISEIYWVATIGLLLALMLFLWRLAKEKN